MSIDPTQRADLPESALFLAPAYPREGRTNRSDLCGTARMWLGNHQWFRSTMPRIDGTLAALDPLEADAQVFVRSISGSMQSLLGGLEGHHGVEDAHYFPAFRNAEPRLGAGIDVLDADHTFIHGAIENLVGSTNRVLAEFGGAVPTAGAARGHLRDDFRAELSRFFAALTRHLDDEEDLVIPYLLHRNGAQALAA